MIVNFRNTLQSSSQVYPYYTLLLSNFFPRNKQSKPDLRSSIMLSKLTIQVDHFYCLYNQIKKIFFKYLVINTKYEKQYEICFEVQVIIFATYYGMNKM